ncbi:MAG: M20/M25/M40 family metallo-hydrolase [Ignavibacteria bacterium]|nr:M20/M25/M40 family metallo-hydrolase [Ignavibacteria bacterium]
MIDKNRLIELFITVAKIEGLSGNERLIADYIKSFLSKLNLEISEDDASKQSGGNTGNLICKIGNGGDFALLSHMDTARSTKDVKHIITKDKITSDGSTVAGVDDRVGVAVLLYAVEHSIKNKLKMKNFTLGFTICEETTLIGSKTIQLGENIDHCFLFDSSFRPGNFVYRTPGAKTFYVEVIGRASHSGIAPEKGINSIFYASKAISRLKLGRIDDETTANIGRINGGTAINVVPESTYIEGEVRSFNVEKVEKIIEQIKLEFKNSINESEAKIKFNSTWDFKPYEISKESKTYIKLVEALRSSNLEPIPVVSFGGSDANSLNERGINTINIGIGAQNPHSNDEFVFLEDLFKDAEIALNLIKDS